MPKVNGIELIRHFADIGAKCSVVAASENPAYLGMIRSLAASLSLADVAGIQKTPIGHVLEEILHDRSVAESGVD